jgi:hypothetical protein
MTFRLFLVSAFFLRSSVLYGLGTEFQFIDGAELHKQHVYDEIPKAFGERVVVFPNGGRPDAVSFVYCEPYESMKDQIKTYFQGAASISEVTTDSQPKDSRYVSQENSQFVAKEIAKRRAAGFRTSQYLEVKVVFPKYNIIAEGNQSSSLTIRLVNGGDIFGIPSSILTVVRLDDTIERMRTFHLGIPLPDKEHSETRIVTDTEIKKIEELERSIKKKNVVAVLTLTNIEPYASFDSLEKFRRALDSCM